MNSADFENWVAKVSWLFNMNSADFENTHADQRISLCAHPTMMLLTCYKSFLKSTKFSILTMQVK